MQILEIDNLLFGETKVTVYNVLYVVYRFAFVDVEVPDQGVVRPFLSSHFPVLFDWCAENLG
jgi:hypothetical protein